MSSFLGNRVIHLIRHAQSEFNVLANHQTEGFVKCVTKLDANLTNDGHEQAQSLGNKILSENINGYHPNDPLSPKNAEVVISSPMTRTILTAMHSMPHSKYEYIIRPEITEQIENTTDIPSKKHHLISKFPHLKKQLSSLPECWWYRHPSLRKKDEIEIDPQNDADSLHALNGEEPAAESKEMVRRRVQWFFKWLWQSPQMKYKNIAVFSHCCTIFEMERFLKGISDELQHHQSLSMPQNTEVRSFRLVQSVATLNNVKQHSNYVNDEHIWNKFDGFYTLHQQQQQPQFASASP